MALTEAKQKAAAKAFAKYWEDKRYCFPIKSFTENDFVAALMKMYQELTAKEDS